LGRLLFFALIAVLVFWLITRYIRKGESQDKESLSIEGEDMVCCAYCDLRLPKSESIVIQDKSFCSEEHHRLYSQ